MVELKYRANPTPVFTEAGDILGAQNAVQEFARLVKDAEGGMLFIDEVRASSQFIYLSTSQFYFSFSSS